MGYTHYWTQNTKATLDRWRKLNQIVTHILELQEGKPTTSAGAYYSSTPVAILRKPDGAECALDCLTNDDQFISFNGAGTSPTGEDLSHETFILMSPGTLAEAMKRPPRYKGERLNWAFCKTARKPYDVLVVAVLEAALRLGVLKEWSSDGEPSDLLQGKSLCDSAFRKASIKS